MVTTITPPVHLVSISALTPPQLNQIIFMAVRKRPQSALDPPECCRHHSGLWDYKQVGRDRRRWQELEPAQGNKPLRNYCIKASLHPGHLSRILANSAEPS